MTKAFVSCIAKVCYTKNTANEAVFCSSMEGDVPVITEEFNKLLRKTISYHDYREDFYHAFLGG